MDNRGTFHLCNETTLEHVSENRDLGGWDENDTTKNLHPGAEMFEKRTSHELRTKIDDVHALTHFERNKFVLREE